MLNFEFQVENLENLHFDIGFAPALNAHEVENSGIVFHNIFPDHYIIKKSFCINNS